MPGMPLSILLPVSFRFLPQSLLMDLTPTLVSLKDHGFRGHSSSQLLYVRLSVICKPLQLQLILRIQYGRLKGHHHCCGTTGLAIRPNSSDHTFSSKNDLFTQDAHPSLGQPVLACQELSFKVGFIGNAFG
jgi:hypothetical protein